MTKEKKAAYGDTETLKQIIKSLKGRKFKLDCGHHVTFGYFLGNDITIYNGKDPEITCSLCSF
jgi:hypothetical protein